MRRKRRHHSLIAGGVNPIYTPHSHGGLSLSRWPKAAVPGWVARTAAGKAAIFDADVENGRFWGANKAYSDEAAFLAALNGTGSDGAYVIGPYLDPTSTNVLVNGDFAEDVDGWSAGIGSLAWVDGEAELTLANGSFTNIHQAIAYPGRAFMLQGTARKGTTANGMWLYAGIQTAMAGGSAVAPTSQNFDSTSNKTASGLFSTYLGTTYLGARVTGATSSGTMLFDDFSAIEAWPLPGWEPLAFSVAITATAPASIAADEVLWQADATSAGAISTEQNRFRIYRKTSDKHLIVEVVNIAGTQVSTDLGEVADNAEFSVAVSFGPNNVVASLNGGAPIVDNTALLPGAAIMRTGQKFSGGTWGGSIERVTVF